MDLTVTMAYQEAIALLGADINQSRECVQKQESQDETNAMPMQIYELHALEKNRRNKLLLQRNLQHQGEIASLERRVRQLNQQLEEQEQVTAEIQQTNHSLQRQQVEQLQKQQTQNDPRSLQLPFRSEVKREQVHCSNAQAHSHRSYNKLHPWKMLMTWRDVGRAPFRVSRGASAVKGSVAYFMNWSGEMCFYSSTNQQWGKLSKCPYQYSSLAVNNGHLTAIGGCTNFCDKETYTNKLLSFKLHSNKTWVEVFPSMPTKRRDTSAVTSKEHLIVAGGMCGPFINSSITTVEVMDVKTLVWSTVASLPHPYTGASGTICGDQLYMLGGSSNERETKSVLTCSVTELLQSSSSLSSIWHRIADAPAYLSTCAAVKGELLAVGGCDEDDKPTSAIHKYNPTTNSWDLISNMLTARYSCLTATMVFPATGEMIVIGGDIGWNWTLAKIEIASFQ